MLSGGCGKNQALLSSLKFCSAAGELFCSGRASRFAQTSLFFCQALSAPHEDEDSSQLRTETLRQAQCLRLAICGFPFGLQAASLTSGGSIREAASLSSLSNEFQQAPASLRSWRDFGRNLQPGTSFSSARQFGTPRACFRTLPESLLLPSRFPLRPWITVTANNAWASLRRRITDSMRRRCLLHLSAPGRLPLSRGSSLLCGRFFCSLFLPIQLGETPFFFSAAAEHFADLPLFGGASARFSELFFRHGFSTSSQPWVLLNGDGTLSSSAARALRLDEEPRSARILS